MMQLPERMKASDWVRFLTDFVSPDDLEEETVSSFVHYLEDLGLLIPCGSGDFKWQELIDGLDLEDQKEIILNGMVKAAQTYAGFAIPFFIEHENIKLPKIESLIPVENNKNNEVEAPKSEHTSDLSNLQIVKKVGRQLKPFLEAEKAIVERLIGERTSKTDARNMFQYMFGKMNSKAQPRKWEQLSRKRHR